MNSKTTNSNRRKFIKDTITSSVGLALISAFPAEVEGAKGFAPGKIYSSTQIKTKAEPRIKFSVIGLNHGHIYSQVKVLLESGGQLVSFYANEPDLSTAFAKKYPNAKLARNEEEILNDKSIQLVVSAAIPNERASLGIQVMLHGKDFMVDKPGIITLQQLEEVRKVQRQSGRIYSINTERLESRSVVKAGELVQQGAIGKVVQTIGLGPHRMNPQSRPDWFFDAKRSGGIICDIASHQFDQYLFFTGTTKAEIVSAQTGNINNPQYPDFQDYGDVTLRGDGGMGFIRVDWFSPEGLKTFGDGRLTILGTEGYIEIRKTIDLAGRAGGHHIFLVNQEKESYIDSTQTPLPYGKQLVSDIINRTETAMSQDYCFQVAELGIQAQQKAQKISI